MILATMPPVAEYRQEFTRETTTSITSAWAPMERAAYKQGEWWKVIVFSRISRFEREAGGNDCSTFNISEQVARRVRSQLSKVSLQSLPLPSVVPLSGHGLALSWSTGTRSVEMTAFADGEITIDALDANQHVDMPENRDLEDVLTWLILPSEMQRPHAAAR